MHNELFYSFVNKSYQNENKWFFYGKMLQSYTIHGKSQ